MLEKLLKLYHWATLMIKRYGYNVTDKSVILIISLLHSFYKACSL